jgi:anion-transporting  ArsA/GET3 family ATPase
MGEVNELFGGWKQRAELVASALRGSDVGYLLVTTPEPMSIAEVTFFAERLASQGLQPSAYVVNRVHHWTDSTADVAALDAVLSEHGLDLGTTGSTRIAQAAAEEHRLAERDRANLAALAKGGAAGATVVNVPDFPRDIHDVSRLAWVADVLV